MAKCGCDGDPKNIQIRPFGLKIRPKQNWAAELVDRPAIANAGDIVSAHTGALFVITGDHHPSRDLMTKGDSRPTAQNDDERGFSKGAKSDDIVSTVTRNSLIIFYKKIYFPNDLVAKVPKKSDRFSLRAGLRFLPPLELINISARCGSYAIDNEADCILQRLRSRSDTREKLKDLPVPLYIGEEDIMRILNIPDVKYLLFKIYYLTKYIKIEFLFKVGLSIQVGRVIKDFKKSIAFKNIIRDHLQEAHEHIYDVEVKALEQ
ncbi:hypothetical protein IEQ34_004107 [Dendrobium chrysotoxum]|uniref:Uncharacterized protein n=1 Tax=Dendrobium chrysotoxum TaxID=161865 RepID=A0AAV7HFG3_DENCH|nr:hypothetical protein IEQ34_004107 [Dendrobium chrysotoxum]